MQYLHTTESENSVGTFTELDHLLSQATVRRGLAFIWNEEGTFLS
jgi:hypothetical protein